MQSQNALPSISVISPTYHEAENIPLLVGRLKEVREAHSLDLELLLMDDNSQDGIVDVVADLNEPWVRLIVRTGKRGLSYAVLDGMRMAEKEVLVCMDADMSHPPEAIPPLVAELMSDHDFTIGSRYVPGAHVDSDWGLFRQLNSFAATLLARPFTTIKDPMSGFFALRRSTFDQAKDLSPIGYKIGLELIVKARCKRLKEVPIHFADRKHGESKLNFTEQLKYIVHIFRLFAYKCRRRTSPTTG